MKWSKIRQTYPLQWLLVEATEAYSKNGTRILEELSVMNTFSDSILAMKEYRKIHSTHPNHEYYVLHTKWEKLEIPERQWIGIRGAVS